MIEAGVPVVPGSVGSESFEQAQELARSFGYPVMLKATAGGGGKECVRSGKMKIYLSMGWSRQNLLLLGMMECILKTNRRASSYRNSGCGIHTEKHVTFLKEIVCTKSSKLTEETPSPFMTDELR
jgi:acetyl-CoA carboxylase biotin carboxylase subunit